MLSFYPGPSKLNPKLLEYINEALQCNILSYNHRSPEFVEIIKSTNKALKNYLKIPEAYSIFYVSSATECWQIISQSFTSKKSVHLYNGAFGARWYQFSSSLGTNTESINFTTEQSIPIQKYIGTDLICLTNCETSNGYWVDDLQIQNIKNQNPEAIVAVDATSCLGGIDINMLAADVWFASVQKCFGLPAGLGILICSPKAVEQARRINHSNHYNSLTRLEQKMQSNQTNITPNMLGIYLLGKTLQRSINIQDIDTDTTNKASRLKHFVGSSKKIKPLLDNYTFNSKTVFALKSDSNTIFRIKKEALNNNILLGNGYGEWAETTFRIANFPAHTHDDLSILFNFLETYL